jgi:hypothetical protein
MIRREEEAFGGAVIVITAGTAGAAAVSHPSNLAPILALIGVILVALLTAYFTRRRQTDQLKAERDRHDATLAAENKRHDATLAAENERLERQLDHERQLQDLAELRSVIDEALQNAELAKNAFLDCRRVALRPTFDSSLYGQVYSAVQHSKEPLFFSFVRVTARGHEQLAYALSELNGGLQVPNINHEALGLDQKREAWEQAMKKVSDWHAAVINLARALVASRLPPS